MISGGPNLSGARASGVPIDRRAFLRRTAALGVTLPLLGTSAACTGKDGDGGRGGFSSPGASGSTGDGAAARLSGQVVIATSNNPPEAAKKALSSAYAKRQPDVKIVWQTKDFGDPANYTSYLGTQLAAKDITLDVVSGGYASTFGQYVNFAQVRGNTNPYTGEVWDQDLDFDFYRKLNAAGEQIMAATQSVHIMWFYNKDLLAKAKVTPPTSWAEFVDACGKLKAAGITPVSANYSYEMPQWISEIYFDQYHMDWVKTVRAQKGDWNYSPAVDGKFTFKPDDPDLHSTYTYNVQRFYKGLKDGVLRYDTARVAEIVTNLAQVFPRYATGDFFVLQDSYAPFLQQQTAMMISGSWSLPTLTNDLASLTPERLKELKIKPGSIKPFKWATFENPPMLDSPQGSMVRSVESSSGEYISIVDKTAPTTAVTTDFVMFWLSKAGYQPYMDAYVEAGQWAPSGPVKISGLTLPKANKIFDSMKFMGNAEVNYNTFWTGGATPTQRTDLHNMLRSALQGKMSPKKYASDLQAYTMDHFEDSLKAASLTSADVENPARRPSGG